MSSFENRFRKYAIPNLTLFLIIGYAVGYLMQLINASFLDFLALDPYKILHGQIWRVFTWLIIPPPSSNFIFVLLMLWCCYSIGNALERTWGTYRYNVFIITGILLTVVASFLSLGWMYLTYGAEQVEVYEAMSNMQLGNVWYAFSTYYINVSIYMAFAMTYPNTTVMIYFLLPVKMKWMGLLDLGYMVYLMAMGSGFTRFAVGAALLNCLIFYLMNIRGISIAPQQIKRKMEFKQDIRKASSVTKHKCAICGKTELSDPGLQFRFCSKCNGNYEYCSNHLFSHTHIK